MRSMIRPASLTDFNQIVDIENACFPGKSAYSRRQLRYLLTKAHRTFLVETQKGQIRGFIILLYKKGTVVAGLETIDVDPTFRRQCIGLELLKAAENEARKKGMEKIRLEVSTNNHAAIALYKRNNYVPVARLKNYYTFDHDGSKDAVRMIKDLI